MDNEEFLRRIKIETPEPQGSSSMKNSLKRLMDKVENFDNNNRRLQQLIFYKRFAAAATICLILAVGTITYFAISRTANIEFAEEMNVSGKVKYLTLSDGSKVEMNVGSKLIYSKEFTGTKREVFLTGEAYFEVAKSKEKPFIVRVGDIAVRVHGTHFNVKAYPNEISVTTTLLEGAVTVENKILRTESQLKPNDVYAYNQLTRKYMATKQPNSISNVSWRNGVIVMDQTSMEEVCRQLERVYNVKIIILNEKIKHKKFTGELRYNEKLNDLMEILKMTIPFTCIINEQTYIIK